MKKNKFIPALSLAVVLFCSACGGDTQTSVHPEDLAEPIGGEVTVGEETAPAPEDAVTVTEVPPAEGMVRSSLTNEWIDGDIANSRPIAVMFPTDGIAQPQYGVGLAGVLYECMEEGGMSRQMGILEGWQDLELIGNIRSCRDYYAYWSMEWDSFLICWGGPFYLADIIKKIDYLSAATIGGGEVVAPAKGDAFYRAGSNPQPHNGYTDGPKLLAAIEKLGYETEHRDAYYEPNHFNFAPASGPNTLEDAPGSFAATEVNLSKIFTTTKTSFTYDEETGTYLKFLYGEPHVDVTTGEEIQLAFTNIIIQNTYWEKRDEKGYLIFQVHDSGRSGYYFTQGRGIPITWTKEDDYSPTRYYDLDGNEIQLNTGRTYIGVAQEGREPIYE